MDEMRMNLRGKDYVFSPVPLWYPRGTIPTECMERMERGDGEVSLVISKSVRLA